MKKLYCLLFLFVFSACSMNSNISVLDNEAFSQGDLRFSAVEATDLSGYVGDEENGNRDIIPKDMMKTALENVLIDDNLFDENSGTVINVDILKYVSGNAFARWLIPFTGKTELEIKATIIKNDKTVATINVSKSISSGGLYTIRAYEYIFKEVAKEIVKKIKSKE